MIDWRIVERLETDKRFFYSSKEETGHFRISDNDGK